MKAFITSPAQACNQECLRAVKFSWSYETSINNHPQQENKSPAGEISVSPGKSLKLHFEREISPIDDRSKDIFPKKYCTCFQFPRKDRGDLLLSPPLVTRLLSNIFYLFLYFRKTAFTSLHIYYLRVFNLITYFHCYIFIIFHLSWISEGGPYLFTLIVCFSKFAFESDIWEEPDYYALILCFYMFHLSQIS